MPRIHELQPGNAVLLMPEPNCTRVHKAGVRLSIFLLVMAGGCVTGTPQDGRQADDLPEGFLRSGDTIRYHDVVLEGVDAAGFRVLDGPFCTDGRRVFHFTSYREGRNYFLTKKHLVQELIGVHPASFTVLGEDYAKDSAQAWRRNEAFPVADIRSLKALNAWFLKDDAQAYLNGVSVPGSHGRSFELIDMAYASDSTGYYYIHDSGDDMTIARIPCEAASFRIIDHIYASDREHVFHRGTIIADARPAAFVVLGSSYARDDRSVFFQERRIPGADPGSFTLFNDNERSRGDVYYAQDKDHIYVNDAPFTGVDRTSFRILDEKYTVDKHAVYYRMKRMPQADPVTFKVFPHYMGDADAEDKDRRYGDGKVVE